MDPNDSAEDFVAIAATNRYLYAIDRVGRVWQYHRAEQGSMAVWTIVTNRRGGAKWFEYLKQRHTSSQPQHNQ